VEPAIGARPVRICLLSVQTPVHVVGGMAEHTVLLARLLSERGHDVVLLTTRHPDGTLRITSDGIDTRYLSQTRPGSQRGGWWPMSRRTFRALHEERAFDVVISQSTGAAGLLALPAAARPPIVVLVHGTTPHMLASLVNARSPSSLRALAGVARKLASTALGMWSIDRPLYAAASALVVFSESEEASVRRWFPSAASRLHRVPHAIDLARFAPDPAHRRDVRASLGIADTDLVLLSVGILSAQKGVEVALEALALIRARRPDVRLIVVGDGPSAEGLHARARRRALGDAARFVGAVPHAEIARYYHAADVFVMPTLRVESFGLVLAEAMACALPVIASRIGATPTVVVHGETGLLVPPGQAAPLADAIDGLIADPARRATMGRAGRARALASYDPDAHVRALEVLVSAVAGRP
jgi:glycosyltransferase involved in cell wall biosynthesis